MWDVGAGSGSVAVECALLGAAVTAVEKTRDGVERIRANADVQRTRGQVERCLPVVTRPRDELGERLHLGLLRGLRRRHCQPGTGDQRSVSTRTRLLDTV